MNGSRVPIRHGEIIVRIISGTIIRAKGETSMGDLHARACNVLFATMLTVQVGGNKMNYNDARWIGILPTYVHSPRLRG